MFKNESRILNQNKKLNVIRMLKIIGAIVFVIIINILTILLMQNDFYSYAIIITLIVINIILFIIIKYIFKNKNQKVDKIKLFSKLIDNLDYLESSNEKVFFSDQLNNIDKATSSHDEDTDLYLNDDGTVINILRPKEIVVKDSIYDLEINFENYCNSLCNYMEDNGLKLEKRTAREIFSSMAASNLILLKHKSNKVTNRFIEIFSDFIGAIIYNDSVRSDWNYISDLFIGDNIMGKCIDSADSRSDLIHILSYDNIDLSRLDNYFSNIIDYAIKPQLPCNIEGMKYLGIEDLPRNIWFMLSVSNEDIEAPSTDLVQSAITIELEDVKVVDPKEVVYQTELKMGFYYLMDTVRDNADLHYVSEEQWKKIDELENFVQAETSFVIDNRVFRQMERYTEMYILCGGDEHEAIDSVLAAKLLIIIAKLPMLKNAKDNEGIFSLCEKLFGLETLSKSKKLLKYIEEKHNMLK